MIQGLRNSSSISCIFLAVKTFSRAESLRKWLVDVHVNMTANQRGLQAMQFSVHLTDLLSTLLRCNGFDGV